MVANTRWIFTAVVAAVAVTALAGQTSQAAPAPHVVHHTVAPAGLAQTSKAGTPGTVPSRIPTVSTAGSVATATRAGTAQTPAAADRMSTSSANTAHITTMCGGATA